jgi:hypothetical protein
MESETRLTLRLPTDLHDALKELARRESRSVNGQIVYLLREAVSRASRQAPEQ